jgi:hypothetical protein
VRRGLAESFSRTFFNWDEYMHKRILGWASAAMLAALTSTAYAQTAGVVTLRANQTSGTGSVTPVLTWSTNPVATSCTASGGWSGTKSASGTQTLAAINANTNYTLTCAWGTGTARVNWTAPTTNTNGSALTNLARFRVLYGTSASSLSQSATVSDPTARTTTISSLSPGTWYFAVRAVNSTGAESDNSNVTTKSVSGASAAQSVSITVTSPTPVPPPTGGTLVTTATQVYDVVASGSGWNPRAVVGTIALGRTCSTALTATGGYYQVARTDGNMNGVVRNGTALWSKALVARCAAR